MTRIGQTFKRLKTKGQAALIPFIVIGDPDLKTTEALISKMVGSGADMIELGVPFSESIADGPTIRAAYKRALQKGVDLKEIFCLTKKLKEKAPPLILMTYFNPVLRYGLKDFAKECKESGIDGVIIPDLPLEEAGPWIQEARKYELDTIFLILPNSSIERIKLVNEYSRGFIYYVSTSGLTGIRKKLPEGLESSVRRVKKHCQKPVVLGFGISTPKQVKIVSRFADGVVVGSAIVKIIEENLDHPDLVTRVGDFVASLSSALKSTSFIRLGKS